MIRQCFLAETGIMFNAELLPKIGLDPRTLHPLLDRPDVVTLERADRTRILNDPNGKSKIIAHKDAILTEEEEDLVDILSPINDELSRSKSWWLLEIIPLKYRHQKKDGTWIWRMRCVRLYAYWNRFRPPRSPPLSQAQHVPWQVHPSRR